MIVRVSATSTFVLRLECFLQFNLILFTLHFLIQLIFSFFKKIPLLLHYFLHFFFRRSTALNSNQSTYVNSNRRSACSSRKWWWLASGRGAW